jgi:phage-related protein
LASLVEILINATDNASSKIDSVNRALDSMGSKAGKTTAVIAGLAGSVAGFAPAVAGIGAMGAMFASAGIGAVGFGAVAVSSIGKVLEAGDKVAQLEEKIKMADSTKERIKAQQELAQVYSQMSGAQRGALTQLQQFKSFWSSFTAEFDKPVFGVFTNGLKLVQNLLTAFQPAMMAVGNALDGFLQKVNSGFDSAPARAFFEYVNGTAGGAFSSILTSAGNIVLGFMGILQAFAPLSVSFGNGMIQMTQKFAQFGQSLSSNQGFQNFINYVKTNTPTVMALIGNLGTIFVKLVTALAPLGTAVLGVAQGFTQWLATSSTVSSVLSAISSAGTFLANNMNLTKTAVLGVVGAFVAFKTVMTIVSVVRAVITAFNMFKTAITAVRTAMIMLNVAMLTNPFTWIVVAIVAVIAIVVLLIMHWDKVKAKAIEMGNAVKQAFTQMVTALAGVGAKIGNFIMTAVQKFQEFKAKCRQAVAEAVTAVVQKLVEMGSKMASSIGNAISQAVARWETFKAKTKAVFAQVVQTAIQKMKEMGSKIASTCQQIVSKAVSVFNQMKSKVSSVISGLVSTAVSKFNQFKSQVSSAIQSTVSKAVSLFNQLKSRAVSAISSLASSITSKIKSAMSAFASAVKSGMSKAASAIKSGVSKMISAVKSFMGTFKSAGKGLLDAFTSGIKSGISKAVGAVKSGMSQIRSYLPFSPAKKGALSDLDKSGESFFPTWYNGALTQVGSMKRAIGGAMGGLNGQLENRAGSVQLDSFGMSSNRVIRIEIGGSVDVKGDTGKEQLKYAGSQVVTQTAETDLLSGLRQAIRKR